MKARSISALGVIGLSLILAGCNKIIIPTTTKIPDDASLAQLERIFPQGRMVFAQTTAWVDSLEIGDVVAAKASSAMPTGLLRKITAKSAVDGKVLVDTEPAALNQAVQRGRLDVTRTLTHADLQETKNLFPGACVYANPAKDGEGFFVGMDNLVVYESGGNKITVSGNVSVAPSFDLNVDIDDFVLQQCTFEHKTNLLATFELNANFHYALPDAWEQRIATFMFAPIEFYIGSVPVVMVPQLQLFLRVEGEATAHLHASAIYQKTATLIAGYQDGAWTGTYTLTDEPLDYSPPTITQAGAEVTVQGGPDFSLLLYGLAGPYGKVQAGMDFSASLVGDSIQWALNGALDGYLGFDVEPLSFDVAEYPLTQLLNYDIPIASGTVDFGEEGENEGSNEGEGEIMEGEGGEGEAEGQAGGEGEEIPNAWSKTYGGGEEDGANAVIQTSDGGYAMAGYSESFELTTRNVWAAKLDAAGNIQWERTFGNGHTDQAFDLLQTSDGGFLVASETHSFGAGEMDFWAVKLTAAGHVDWQSTCGGDSIDDATAVTDTGDGFVLAGNSYSFSTGTGDDDGDIFVVKFNNDGTLAWAKAYTGFGSHASARAIVRAANGDLMLAGAIADLAGGWIMRLTSAGALVWAYAWDVDLFNAIRETDTGFVVAGRYTPWYCLSCINAFVMVIDDNAQTEWARIYAQEDEDTEARDVVLGEDTGFAVAIKVLIPDTAVWIFRLNNDGQVVWARDYQAGGLRSDVNALFRTQDAGGLTGYVLAGNEEFSDHKNDAWLMKLPADGVITFNAASQGVSTNLSGTFTDITPARTDLTITVKDLNGMVTVTHPEIEVADTAAQSMQQAP